MWPFWILRPKVLSLFSFPHFLKLVHPGQDHMLRQQLMKDLYFFTAHEVVQVMLHLTTFAQVSCSLLI